MKKILLFICFILFSVDSKADDYDIVGIYIEVDEDEAYDEYHHIEYDNHYYIPIHMPVGRYLVRIKKVLNSRLYQIEIDEKERIYYAYLKYPAFLFKDDSGKIFSEYFDSYITIY